MVYMVVLKRSETVPCPPVDPVGQIFDVRLNFKSALIFCKIPHAAQKDTSVHTTRARHQRATKGVQACDNDRGCTLLYFSSKKSERSGAKKLLSTGGLF